MRPDAVVVGAGIVGAACAEALARDGLRVEVWDAAFPGGGVTATGMGHIVAMDDSPEQLAFTAYARRLWSERAAELSPACEDDACGTLWVASDEQEMALVRDKARTLVAAGVAAEIVDAAGLCRLEPLLRPGLAGGLRVPDDRVVYPPAAARWLLERAQAAGTRVRGDTQVTRLGPRRLETRDAGIDVGLVVNAAGLGAPELTPGLPIVPRRGHLVITDRYPELCHHQVLELGYLRSAGSMEAESVAFNVQPRTTGQLLVGSSREFVGRDATLNRPLVARMLARACAFMPGLVALHALRIWMGFRPATPDKRPLIGRWPAVDGLWIAAGHEGLGITTALATGRLLADLVAGRKPVLDPAPYDPSRETTGG